MEATITEFLTGDVLYVLRDPEDPLPYPSWQVKLISWESIFSQIPKPYRLKLTVKKPTAGQPLIIDPVTDAVLFPAGLSSCRGVIDTNNGGSAPAEDAVFSLQKNGVQFGTMTISAGETEGVFDSDADISLDPEAGDVFSFVAPTIQDPSLTNVGVTIHGERI